MGYTFKPGASPTVDAYRARYGDRICAAKVDRIARQHGITAADLMDDGLAPDADELFRIDDVFATLGY